MALKKECSASSTRSAKPGAILATNTSYLDVDEIAAATTRPRGRDRHALLRAGQRHAAAGDRARRRRRRHDVLATAIAVGKQASARCRCVVGVCDGFVGNRMLAQRGQQAEKLLLEGALPQQVDARGRPSFGFPMGPFAMGDLAGLDIGWRVAQGRAASSADRRCAVREPADSARRPGRATTTTKPARARRIPDPEVEKMIDETSQKLGKKRRAVSDRGDPRALLYPMVNEGARILEEGIAARPSDIDVIWVNGYGWPVYRGGPMFWADRSG